MRHSEGRRDCVADLDADSNPVRPGFGQMFCRGPGSSESLRRLAMWSESS